MLKLRIRGFEAAPILLACCVAWPALAPIAALAQPYPAKPVRLVIGFPPGGSNDIVARHLAPKLSELLGIQVLVENRPGANATVGTEYVAKSAPDGYTLTLGSASPFAISPHTYPNIPYDVLRDFTGVTTVAMTPEILAIHPALPIRSVKEFVALAKARPGELTLASAGNGGLPHLAIELFKSVTRTNILHVPYKGAGPALTDLLGGHVHAMIMDFPVVYPSVKNSKLRGLAVLSEGRNPLLPELPTSAEQGLGKLLAVNWFAVMGPAKLPKPIVDRLYGALTKAATAPEVKERLVGVGVQPMTSASPEAFSNFLRDELVRWGKIAKESGARAD